MAAGAYPGWTLPSAGRPRSPGVTTSRAAPPPRVGPRGVPGVARAAGGPPRLPGDHDIAVLQARQLLRAEPARGGVVPGPEPHDRVKTAAQGRLGLQDRRDPALGRGREEAAESHDDAFLSQRVTGTAASERGLVGVAAGVVGRPRVGFPAAGVAWAAGVPGATGVARPAGRPPAALAADPRTITGTGPGHPVHLGGRVTQRRTDVIDLDLIHRALLAFLGLIRALPQPTRDDHPNPAGQALRDVLRGLPPHVAGQEQAVAVLPLIGVLVEVSRGGRDPELRDG